jgi:hypothetical protein
MVRRIKSQPSLMRAVIFPGWGIVMFASLARKKKAVYAMLRNPEMTRVRSL